MPAFLSFGFSLVLLGLFFWAINALSVMRNQLDEVIGRLERIEAEVTRASTPGAA